MNSPKSIRAVFSGDEIVLFDIWLLFWSRRKYLFICIPVFLLIGFIEASTTPTEYSAKCVLLGEEGGGGASPAAQALAGLTGSTPPSGGGGVTDLYPIIMSSQPFLNDLAKDTVTLQDNSTTTIEEYALRPLKKDAITKAKVFISGFPGSLKVLQSTPKPVVTGKAPAPQPVAVVQQKQATDSALAAARSLEQQRSLTKDAQKVTIEQLSGADMASAAFLKSRIKLTQEGRQVYIIVSMPEAKLSAEVAKLVLDKLIQYVVRYKTGKQLENLRFLEARASEASSSYKRDQSRVAGFADNNYGVVYQTVKSKESQLANEYNISFNTYNQLAAQLEQARIDLKKQTPLFTILEPIYVPLSPQPVDTSKIILKSIGMGIALAIILIFINLLIEFFKEGRKRQPSTSSNE